MELIRYASYFLLILVAGFQICASLEDSTFYHIRNIADDTYIKVESGAVVCRSIGYVVASSSLVSGADSYRWRYNLLSPTTRAYLEINDSGYNGLDLNEVSMYSGGSYCYFAYQEMDIIPVSNNVYRIKRFNQGECLVSNVYGSDKGFHGRRVMKATEISNGSLERSEQSLLRGSNIVLCPFHVSF